MEDYVRGSALAVGLAAVLVNRDVDVQLLEENNKVMHDIWESSSDRPWRVLVWTF